MLKSGSQGRVIMSLSRFALFIFLIPLVVTAQAGFDNACLDLKTGKIMEGIYCSKPSGPIIRGHLEKSGFEPTNTVEFAESATEPDPRFAPGWIELHTGAIHYDYEGRGPQSPYLRGRIDTKGYFYVDPAE